MITCFGGLFLGCVGGEFGVGRLCGVYVCCLLFGLGGVACLGC